MLQKRSPLEVRNRHHDFSESIPKYFDSGNVVLTAEWYALNLTIPPGERYFIRSVQRLASRVKDPGLKLQIKGFIGQETMHSKETNRFLDILEKQGFPVSEFEVWYDRLVRWGERISSPIQNLAGAAGGEHYTAVISLWLLRNFYCDRFPQAIRAILEWHAAEELEHKAMSFDMLQELTPHNYLTRYTLRIIGFLYVMVVIWIGSRKAVRMFLKWEGLSRAQIREERKRARKIRIPLMSLWFPHLLDYLKPGFHPNDLDDGGLSKKILAEQAARKGA